MSTTGLYFAALQLFFTLTWTVYVIFLPRLAAEAGIPKEWIVWILLADQVVFTVADWWMGARSDQASKVLGRLGLQAASITLVSALAFLVLPLVAPGGNPWLFLAATLVWTVTSSALRAPPLMLIGKYAGFADGPRINAMWLFGLGVAGAIAPYLTVNLRDADPRLPFALASIAVGLVAWGLVWAEKRLAGAAPAVMPVEPPTALLPVFLAAVALAALGFQVHFSLNAAAGYLRFAGPADLDRLMPVFWIGFNLAMLPLGWLGRRTGDFALFAAGCAVGAVAGVVSATAGSLDAYAASQFAAGAAWGAVMLAAFGAASALGRSGREGLVAGGLFSMLAGAAMLRIGLVASQWNAEQGVRELLTWLPAVCWSAAAVLVIVALVPRRALSRARSS